MENERFESFSSLIGNTWKNLNRLKNKKMAVYGLGSAHTICMRHLYGQPQGLTKTELARLCEVDKAQISRVTGILIEKGYAACIGTGKSYNRRLILTQKGEDTTREINRIVTEINNYVSGDIPEEDLRAFYRTLETICENLRKAEEKF